MTPDEQAFEAWWKDKPTSDAFRFSIKETARMAWHARARLSQPAGRLEEATSNQSLETSPGSADAAVSGPAQAQAELQKLIHYFNNEGRAWGNEGDYEFWTTCETSIKVMERYRASLAQPQPAWTDADVERAARAYHDAYFGDGVWDQLSEDGGSQALAKRSMRQALASLPPGGGIGEGWVLVPREPDIRQTSAAINAKVSCYGDDPEYPPVICDVLDSPDEVDRLHGFDRDAERSKWCHAAMEAIYRAMLAAAPQPPTHDGKG